MAPMTTNAPITHPTMIPASCDDCPSSEDLLLVVPGDGSPNVGLEVGVHVGVSDASNILTSSASSNMKPLWQGASGSRQLKPSVPHSKRSRRLETVTTFRGIKGGAISLVLTDFDWLS